MAIELVTKFSPKVDELFTQESRLSLLTNKDYDFDGANIRTIIRNSNNDGERILCSRSTR